MRFAAWRRLNSAIAIIFFLAALFSFPSTAADLGQSPVVLFDEGHDTRFVIGKDGPLDLSQFAELIRQNGAVVVSSKERLTGSALADKRGLILAAPFAPYTRGEIDALVAFVIDGGRMAIMLHIPMPVFSLLYRFNVLVSRGVIQEHRNLILDDSKYFRTGAIFPHPLTRGLQGFNVNGAWALFNSRPNVEILAETSPQAWIDQNGNNKMDTTDPSQSFAVLVAGRLGKGEYLVFSDDSIFQNRFLVGDNRKLAENLAAWLLN